MMARMEPSNWEMNWCCRGKSWGEVEDGLLLTMMMSQRRRDPSAQPATSSVSVQAIEQIAEEEDESVMTLV